MATAQEVLHIIFLCIVYLLYFLVHVNEHHNFATATQILYGSSWKEHKTSCSRLKGKLIFNQQYQLDPSAEESVKMSKVNKATVLLNKTQDEKLRSISEGST